MTLAAWLFLTSLPPPSPVTIPEWGERLDLDPGIVAEIREFQPDQFTDEYAEDLARGVRRLIFECAAERLASLDAASLEEPDIRVSYAKPGFTRPDEPEPEQKRIRKFEESFVRTEAVAFFPTDLAPAEALTLYTAPEFRKRSSSRIESITEEDGLSCVETRGVGPVLDPTLSCNRIDELHREELSSQHSQVVANPGGDDDFQRVFFKASLKTFVAVEGGLVLHYVNYARTQNLSGLSKKIGKGKIKGAQERMIEELANTLEEHAG